MFNKLLKRKGLYTIVFYFVGSILGLCFIFFLSEKLFLNSFLLKSLKERQQKISKEKEEKTLKLNNGNAYEYIAAHFHYIKKESELELKNSLTKLQRDAKLLSEEELGEELNDLSKKYSCGYLKYEKNDFENPIAIKEFHFQMESSEVEALKRRHIQRKNEAVIVSNQIFTKIKGEEKYIIVSTYIESNDLLIILLKSEGEVFKALNPQVMKVVSKIKFGENENGKIIIADGSGKVISRFGTDNINKKVELHSDISKDIKDLGNLKEKFIGEDIKDLNGKIKSFQKSYIKKYKNPNLIVVTTLYLSSERKISKGIWLFVKNFTISFYVFSGVVLLLIFILLLLIANFFLQRLDWEFQTFSSKLKNSLISLKSIDDKEVPVKEFHSFNEVFDKALVQIYEIKNFKSLFRETINQSYSDVIFLVDEESTIVEALGQIKSIIGMNGEELIGKKLNSTFKNSFRGNLIDEIANNNKGQLIGKIIKHFRPDGLKIFLQVDVKEVFSNNSNYKVIIMKDISQKLILEESMKDTSKAYSLLFENMDDMIFVNKLNINTYTTNVFTVNKLVVEKLGYREEEIIGKPFDDLLDLQSIKDEPELSRKLAMGERIDLRASMVKKNGEIMNVEIVGVPFETEDFQAVMFFIKDNSYSYFLANELKESEARLKKVFKEIPSISLLIDLSKGGKIMEANREAQAFYGYDEDEFGNLNINALVVTNDNNGKQPSAIVESGTKRVKHRTKENFIKNVETSSTTVKIKGRDILIMLVRDMTLADEERRTFNSYRESLKETLDDQLDMVYCLNGDGKYIFVNSSFEKYFDLKEKNIIGLKHMNHIHPDEDKENNDLLNDGTSLKYESWVLNKRGERKLFEISKKPLHGDNRSRSGIICWMKDITDSKNIKEELSKVKKELTPTNIFKGNLLANMSHEIRTPMNGIIGLSDMLMQTRMNKQQREYLSIINKSSNSLLKIINDILDLSQIESGKSTLKEIEFSINELVEDTIALFKPQLLNKGIEVSYSLSKQIPSMVLGDYYKIRQVLTNLVGNAIKFTNEGKVHIKVSKIKSTEDSKVGLKFEVKDSGIGIDEKDLDKLFSFFSRVENLDEEYEGTGLGLIISKKLMEILDGHISVESNKGKGSNFMFELRLKKVVDMNLNVKSATIIGEKANHYKYNTLEKMLNNLGVSNIKIITQEAIENGEAIDEKEFLITFLRFDNIVKLREGLSSLKVVKVAFFERNLNKEEQKSLEEIGFGCSISGNADINELYKAFTMTLGEKSNKYKAWSFIDARKKRKEKILLLEDNEVNSIIACDLIKKRGFEVVAYNRVKEALEQVDFKKIDLILADINMPDINGMEATSIIRKITKEFDKYIPIIAVTAYTLPGDREKCLDAGMDDYITKPIDKDDLYKKIDKYLDMAKKNKGLIDVEDLYYSFENNVPLIKKVVGVIIKNIPVQIKNLERAFEKEDFKKVELISHSFKGSLGSIKPKRSIDHLSKMEKLAALGDMKECKRKFRDLVDNLNKLNNFLVDFESKLGGK